MVETATARSGAIDSVEDLKNFDIVTFNGGLNPWGNAFATGAFSLGSDRFRSMISKWRFTGHDQIADLGSGFGRWSFFLAESNRSVIGFERNSEGVELSRKLAAHFKLDNVKFECTDVGELTRPDESFDHAWCYNALHYFNVERALPQIRRILRPKGRLFVGCYPGLGTVLQWFFEGYAQAGGAHRDVSLAIRSLKQGPGLNGPVSYLLPDMIESIMRPWGFKADSRYSVAVEMGGSRQPLGDWERELDDLPALADRLKTDPEFARAFARRPEIANCFPKRLHFSAVKA